MVRIKICGVTNRADAVAAAELGASALGFNFYEKSPRVVTPSAAWDIIRKLPPFVAPVGVFVNWKPSAVIALARSLHLAAVQLHGDESPDDVKRCARHFPVIKAFRIGPRFSMAEFSRFAPASAFLLDSAASQAEYGGTGHVSDWTFARRAAKKHCILLAGGLKPQNVAEAVRVVAPYAVDVASGVESRPGKKDRAKLRDFFAQVRRGERDLGEHAPDNFRLLL